MDLLFTFFILLSLDRFRAGLGREYARKALLQGFLFAALAVLTKGPFGFVFTILPVTIYSLIRKGKKGIRFLYLGQPGFLIFCLLVGGWLAAAVGRSGWDYLNNILGRQIISRTLNSFAHAQPLYYYIPALLLTFLPWTPLLPRAASGLWRRGNHGSTSLRTVYFFTAFVILSLVSCKLFIYLLPLLPMLALCIGIALYNKSGLHYLEGLGLVLCSSGIFAFVPFGILYLDANGPLLPMWITPFFLILAGLGMSMVLLRCSRTLLGLTFLSVWVFSLCLQVILVPQINLFYSPKKIGREIAGLREEGKTAVSFGLTRGVLDYYAGYAVPTVRKKGLEALLSRDAKQEKILIIKKNHWIKRPLRERQRGKILFRQRINRETYYLISLGRLE
jgi:4-amino-4-deoxy-L-arabinose transferase-like glycosyltransferase